MDQFLVMQPNWLAKWTHLSSNIQFVEGFPRGWGKPRDPLKSLLPCCMRASLYAYGTPSCQRYDPAETEMKERCTFMAPAKVARGNSLPVIVAQNWRHELGELQVADCGKHVYCGKSHRLKACIWTSGWRYHSVFTGRSCQDNWSVTLMHLAWSPIAGM